LEEKNTEQEAKVQAQKQLKAVEVEAQKKIKAAEVEAQKKIKAAEVEAQKKLKAVEVEAQKKLKAVGDHLCELQEEKARLQGAYDKEKSLRAHEAAATQSALQDAMSGKNVVGLASMLGVSPKSLDKVENASKRGSLQTTMFEDASTPAEKVRDQNSFVKRIAATLTPVVERVCAAPKFMNGKTDVGGVASLILGKIARKKSQKSKRRLNFDARPRGVSPDLDSLLKEMAEAWRDAWRNHNRDASARILQLTLKAIPQRTGRVTSWLGPRYY